MAAGLGNVANYWHHVMQLTTQVCDAAFSHSWDQHLAERGTIVIVSDLDLKIVRRYVEEYDWLPQLGMTMEYMSYDTYTTDASFGATPIIETTQYCDPIYQMNPKQPNQMSDKRRVEHCKGVHARMQELVVRRLG